MSSLFFKHIKTLVLEQITRKESTAKELKEELKGVAQSTLYKAISELESEGKIRKIESLNGRNFIYTLGNHNHPIKTKVPNLTFKGTNLKAIYYLDPLGFNDEMNRISRGIIYQLARVLDQANRVHQGQAYSTTAKQLKRIRVSLEETQRSVFLINDLISQILKEPRFWEPELLEKMPEDEVWNYDKIDSTIAYFTEENN